MTKAHQYVIFHKDGQAVSCIFAGKPDAEFDQLIGRTQIRTDDRVYHVAFDLQECDREFIWKWFERFTNAQSDSDS